MTRNLRQATILALACCGVASGALAQESPKDIIAAHVRLQGYKCDAPQSARRDVKASRPGEAAWRITCENARYKVRMIPGMADAIEPF
ncbi:hypothetical protein ACNHKD_05765 [Methylocystis sp. JAN1]|uniref:hypothetical protein n=1 Tax=Methylocystis sp. JAN1 TaxID=3397211 RepID=UPI003FA1D627